MPVAHRSFLRISTGLICVLLLGLGLYWSCSGPHSKDEPHLSVQGQKVLHRADSLSIYGQGKQGMAYIDSAYRTFNPNIKDLFEKYNYKAQNYVFHDIDQVKANCYIDSMFLLLKGKEHVYRLEYAMALFLKGDALSLVKDYDKAFKYYYDAKQYNVKGPDSCQIYQFSGRLGLIKYKQGHYLEAIPYFKQALVEISSCTDKLNAEAIYTQKQGLLNTIAICFEKVGQLERALYYYEQSLALIDRLVIEFSTKNNFAQRAKGVVLGNIGGVYLQQGKYMKAEKYLKESITINDRIGFEVVDAQTAKLKLADVYLRLANFSAAHVLLEELQFSLDHPILENKMTTESRLKLYRLQWQYFDRIHDQSKAYQKIQQYYPLLDSLNHITESVKGADMDLAFKTHEQQYKLALSDKENEIKMGCLIAFAVFSIIIIIALFVVWRSRQKLGLMNNKISAQNSDMQKLLMALEQSQKENTRMMTIVAHDLRSPMAACISIAAILKNSHLSKEDYDLLAELETSGQHSLAMIEDLLNFNEEPKALVKEAVELNRLLDYCINLFKFKATEKGLELRLKTLPVAVQADGEKIWRVFSNLLMNAIKFSTSGTIIEVNMYLADKNVLVKVQDQGIGIPTELKDKIFDSFTDVRRQGTAGEPSFGMGLAISKQLIEAHAGKIWFESEEGVGTTFWVSLPIN